MKENVLTIFTVIGVLLFITLLGFGINYAAMQQTAFFSPKYEAIRRDTMIQSRAYGEAETRAMYNYKRQFIQAKTPEEKAAIRAMAVHEADALDRSRLPEDLQIFINSLGE